MTKVLGLITVLISCVSCGVSTDTRSIATSRHNGVHCDINTSSLELQALKGIPIQDHGIDASEKLRHINEIAKLPAIFLNRLRAANFSIQLTRRSITDFPKFAKWKNVTPPGWPAGSTYADVPGTGYIEAVYLGDSALANNAYSLAIHETTHSLDAIVRLQQRREVQQAFRLERAHGSDTNGSYRYSSVSEFLAVGIDEYFCSERTRANFQARYPKTFRFFSHDLPKLLR